MLAKLGRIIVIAQELRGLAERPNDEVPDTQELRDIIYACKNVTLPTEEDVTNAIDILRQGVEVWLNGTASAPLTFDNSWGGVISCGCLFNGQDCDNIYPNCPAYSDPGLNFGQGMYNDHHFHYGYHIYAAAILAEFDRDWGRLFFERVLLLIRDIANPSVKDPHFPVFRQKDWLSYVVIGLSLHFLSLNRIVLLVLCFQVSWKFMGVGDCVIWRTAVP